MTRTSQLSQRLKEPWVSISEVSRLSGVSRPAILSIRDGVTANPGILTIERIERALSTIESKPVITERSTS
jgi:predicted transcriptional regulator